MAMGFSEGRLGFEIFRVDIILDDNFRFGGHEEIDGACLHHIYRSSHEATCNGKFIYILAQFLYRREGHRRRCADDNGCGTRSPRALYFSQ